MQTQTIQINANPHPGQAEVHNHPARFKVLAAGRRWGKTRLGVNECLSVAARGGRAWWVAPTYKMSEGGWRPLQRIGTKINAEVRKAERHIILPNRGEITVRSADNPDSLRGEGLDFVVLDEVAYMTEQTWTEVLRAALSDRQGKGLFISTPKRRNWFFQYWLRGQDAGEEWQSWRFPTSANPYISPDEIEAARLGLPEDVFNQEYLAEFLEGEGHVFRNIRACMGAPLDTDPGQHEKHVIVGGLDWAKHLDFTTISFGCKTCKREVARDRFNKIDYVYQRQRIKAMCEKWRPTAIKVELNAMGEPNFENLAREDLPVIGFTMTAVTKPPLIENLGYVFERGEWQFQSDPIWTGELEAYERTVNRVTGRSTYSAPEGLHDDTVVARALMIDLATGYVPIVVQPELPSRWKYNQQEPERDESKWRKY